MGYHRILMQTTPNSTSTANSKDVQFVRDTNAFLHIRHWSVDIIQSSSPQSVKVRVPVVHYLAMHSSDRRRFCPCRWCQGETVAGRSKPRHDDGWRPIDDSARQHDRRPVLLLIVKDKINSSFTVHWRHPCRKPDQLQNWLLQYRLCKLTEQYDRSSPECAACRCQHHHGRAKVWSQSSHHTYPEKRASLAAGDATYNIQIVLHCL